MKYGIIPEALTTAAACALAYAYQYSAEVQRITDHGVSQREEQSYDIRQARKSQVQVRKPAFLGTRILCGYGRKE